MTTNNLTEQWKKGELESGWYYVNYYSIDGAVMQEYLPQHNGFGYDEKNLIQEVLAEVPDYDNWRILNELLENSLQTNKVLSHISRPFMDSYFKGLSPKDIAELAKKSIRLTKQSCEDNTTIQRLKELLGYCADILEELDDKDRDIEILLEEVNEVLA